MSSAFRLFRGSPSTSRPSSRDTSAPSESPTKRKGSNSGSSSSISKHARTVTDGDVTSSPIALDGPGAESAAAGLGRRQDQGQDANNVPSIEVTSSSPSTHSANFASDPNEQQDAPPAASSFSQKRGIHAQGFSEGGPGLTQLKMSKSAKRASRIGMSEDQQQGPVSAVEWGSGGPGGHSRYASAGPLTAGANRHDVMRRAQNFNSGLESSSEEEDDDDDEDGDGAGGHTARRDDGQEGGYDDVADGRRLNQLASTANDRPGAPRRARSNSDTDLPPNHPHHHASLPPMPHTALHPSGHSSVTPKEEGDEPSHAPMFDTVPGEGSLTLDHILGSTGPEVVTVDGAVRPGSSIGHGADISASRRASINRGAAASSQGHGSIGEFGQMMKVNGKLAAAKGASDASSSSQGNSNGGPPLALIASGTSKPAEALLSTAQVSANGKQQQGSNKKRPSLGPKGGIASALAASGMTAAGTSVSGLNVNGVSPARTPSPAAIAALTPGAGAEAPNGFQGGVYRNPSTGQMVEVGEGQQGDGEFFAPMSRDPSGLSAAANFQPSNAPLISPMASSKSMPTAANNVNEFAGGLGMDLAAAMADNPALAPDSANMDSGVAPHRRSSTTSALANDSAANWPDGPGIETQITGFAVASSKRNADFHGMFQSVPEDDYLIEGECMRMYRESDRLLTPTFPSRRLWMCPRS